MALAWDARSCGLSVMTRKLTVMANSSSRLAPVPEVTRLVCALAKLMVISAVVATAILARSSSQKVEPVPRET